MHRCRHPRLPDQALWDLGNVHVTILRWCNTITSADCSSPHPPDLCIARYDDTINDKSKLTTAAAVTNSLWPLKFLAVAGSLGGAMFLPEPALFGVYAEVARVLSLLWMLFQVLRR